MFICCKRIKALKHFLVFSFRMTSAVFHMTHSDVLSHFFLSLPSYNFVFHPRPSGVQRKSSFSPSWHSSAPVPLCVHWWWPWCCSLSWSEWLNFAFPFIYDAKISACQTQGPRPAQPPPFFFLKDTELRRLETGTVTYLLIRPVWVLTSANAVITVVYTWVHSEGLWQCSGAVN